MEEDPGKRIKPSHLTLDEAIDLMTAFNERGVQLPDNVHSVCVGMSEGGEGYAISISVSPGADTTQFIEENFGNVPALVSESDTHKAQ